MDRSDRLILVSTAVFAVAAVVLTITHLVLEAGPAAEAPRWIIYLAMAPALVAAALSGYIETRRRRHR